MVTDSELPMDTALCKETTFHCLSSSSFPATDMMDTDGVGLRSQVMACAPERNHQPMVTSSPSCGCWQGNAKGTSSTSLGPMRIKQSPMSVLLVFAKEDAQSDGFWWAAQRGGYQCNLCHNPEGALECYLDKHHDVIIIDARRNKHFDAESLCRLIRATKCSEHTVIVAITKKIASDCEEPSVLPLLQAGVNKRLMENPNTSVCLNELLQLEHSEIRAQVKLRAAGALLTALEHSKDAIEVTSEDWEIQYVNSAYERAFGYTCEEILGKDVRELSQSERNKPDLYEAIANYLKKGKTWESVYYANSKSGDSISQHCKTIPVNGPKGKLRHFVSIKNPVLDVSGSQILEKFNGDLVGGLHQYRSRRESMIRMHSMTIEAPITKIISMINQAQENSPITVVQALDNVLEILRSSELYAPYLQQVKDDEMTNDYVGGLMTRSLKKSTSPSDGTLYKSNTPTIPSSPLSSSILSQIPPEIQNILVREAEWDLDVIDLERVTKRRPLVYLGLKTFQRFGLLEFLRISERELVNWLQLIESKYHETNSYHNSTHAADVLHATAYFLSRDKCKNVLDQLDEVSALIAAVVHDVDHPGRTNSFLVNSCSSMALLYNDLAVLECHHASLAFQLTSRDSRVNILKNLERDDFRALRQQVIDMVLATEMTKHFEHVNKFISSVNQPSKDEEESTRSGSSTPDSAKLATPENRALIKRMLIKCADVSNPCRPLPLCVEWAKRIAEEYFLQTDEEKRRNLTVVMPMFDRTTCNVPKSQTSFIDFFINGMFDAWDAFCDIPEVMKLLRDNYAHWESRIEEAQAKLDSKTQLETNT